MKAINFNKKYALPLMLLGLLALETNWEQFTNLPGMSGDYASNSADARRRASEVCANSQNDVAAALSQAARQGDAEFYFRGRNDSDLTDTIEVEVEGERDSTDIEYNATVMIRGIRDDRGSLGPFPRHHIRRNSAILENFGGNSTRREAPVPAEDPDTGEAFDVECKWDSEDNEIKYKEADGSRWRDNDYDDDGHLRCQFPTYRYFEVQVRTETTEGDWCEDCDSESAVEESETRYIEVRVYPEPDSMTNICEDTYAAAQRLFNETERDMKEGIADAMEEVLEIAEREDLEEYREELEEQCRIRPGASLDDIRDYREDRGSIDDDLLYSGDPEEKMECLVDNGHDQDTQREREAYFRANTVPFLRNQLTSGDENMRSIGRDLLMRVRGGEMGSLTMGEQGHLNFIAVQSQNLETMYRLTAMVERHRGTPQEVEHQMRLDMFKRQMDLQANSFAGADPAVFGEMNYWQNQMNTLSSTAGIVNGVNTTTYDANTLNYNLAGRGTRLAAGHLPLASAFADARARISSVPNFMESGSSYYRGGTDAYERTYTSGRSTFSATRPPGPEMGGDRLARTRN